MSDRAKRTLRRFVTVPLFILAFVGGLAALPVVLPISIALDVLRGSRLAITRGTLFLVFYFGCETAGILRSGWLWLRFGLTSGRSGPAWIDAHYALQSWWASALLNAGRILLGFRLDVQGGDVVPREGGPFFLFIRHVSVADTVLAAQYLSAAHGHRLRYVLKSELLWDPCLDIVGHRLPNCFVERGAKISGPELQKIRGLAQDLSGRDGVLIYPEGTRFTPERREAVLRRMEVRGDKALLERARALENVLPPRLGGTLALLEEGPEADAVFCAHEGFEGTMRLTDLLSGSLVGRRVGVAFWRIPSVAIPRGREAQSEWLFDRWEEIDLWIDARLRRRPIQ